MEIVKGRGRPKYSAQTPQRMAERFLRKEMSSAKLSRLYNSLKPELQLKMLDTLLPYTLAKKQADTLSADEVDALHQKLEQAINAKKAI